jgi:hypothetical protein
MNMLYDNKELFDRSAQQAHAFTLFGSIVGPILVLLLIYYAKVGMNHDGL